MAHYLTLLAVLTAFSCGEGSREIRSIPVTDRLDRYHRSIDVQLEEELAFLDDHGHAGHDDYVLPERFKYTNEWVVKITGGPVAAARLAEEMGFEIFGEVRAHRLFKYVSKERIICANDVAQC